MRKKSSPARKAAAAAKARVDARTGGKMPAAGVKKEGNAGLVGRFLLAANSNLPYYFVLLVCLAFALELGILEPQFLFQKSPAEVLAGANCPQAAPAWAFASEERLLLYLPHSQPSEAAALFDGRGEANGVRVGFSEPMMGLYGLWINGEKLCSPCSSGEYHLANPASGRLKVRAEAAENDSATAPTTFAMALFDKEKQTHALAPLSISVEGGWRAVPNSAMPSSFYGVDAPFHVNRVEVLSGYLAQLRWPWADYSFISVLPSSLLQLAGGISHQYAYKVYSIALFFVPVLVFFLFSRKLKSGGRPAFMFASLLYLAMPVRGYLTGGLADLFIYGMMPHALATYLSLFFLYFAYEFVW